VKFPWALPKAATSAAPLGRKTENLKTQDPANTGEELKEFLSPEGAAWGDPEGNAQGKGSQTIGKGAL